MVYVFLIIILILGTIFLSFSNSNLENYYDRKLPKEKAPICMYYYNGKFNGKEFWVTLLDLIDNDIYKLENISGTKYLIWNKKDMFSIDYLKLKTYEEKLVLFINSLIYEDNKGRRIEFEELKEKVKLSPTIDKTMKDFYTILNNEIEDTYGTIRNDHKYSKVFIFNLVFLLMGFAITSGITYTNISASLLIDFIFVMISTVFVNTRNIFKSAFSIFLYAVVIICAIAFISAFIFPAILGGLFVYDNPLKLFNLIPLFIRIFFPLMIISNIIMLKYSKRFSNNSQRELYLNLIGLKNFMVEFTNTCTRPIDYINFLDKYYVLAVALDVNLKEYDYLKGVYDDDTIHTFDADDLIRRLEDGTLLR